MPDDADEIFREAAREQDSLGFLQFIKGRISKKWQQAQLAYSLNRSQNRVVCSKWSARMITRLIRFEWEIWKFRNEIQAIVSAEKKEIRDERKRRLQIEKELERGVAGLRPRGHYMVTNVNGDGLIDLPADEQEAWLGQIDAARKRYW